MTPEAKARERIDHKLAAACWVVQDLKQLNLGAAVGVAVRVSEAKRDEPSSVLLARIRAERAVQAKLRNPRRGKELS